jgi:hypothetical protein
MVFAVPSRVRQTFIVWHSSLLLVSWSKLKGEIYQRISQTYASPPGIAGGLPND